MITPIPTIAHQLDVEPFKGVHVPSALVVDGEAVSRNEPCQQLAQLWPELSIVGDVGTGTEALQLIDRFQPDVVFLDIQLPGLMGLDVARQAQGKCHVIFVTTHEADATAAFEVGALDYVLKPILPSRLLLAIARIKQASNLRMHRLELLLRELAMNIVRPPRYLRWINAAAGDSVRLIAVEDVQYFRADGKYTVLVTSKSESLIRKTLQELNADRNFKRPSGSRLPTTCLRVTGLMLRPSLGAAWLAWQIGPPVGFGAEPSAVAGPPSQRAAPPAWRPLRPSLELRTSGPLPARSPVNEIGTYPPVHSRLDCAGGPRAPSGSSLWDCSGAVRSRCDRIFAMSCGSSMLAMIFSSPPQRVQLSISTANTRFNRRAQLIATCRGVETLAGSASDAGGRGAPRPRCAGVTTARC